MVYGKGIKFEYESEFLELMIYSDWEKFWKILFNLVFNVIKFIFWGGVVKMCVDEKNEDVSFIVIDIGIGIVKEKFFYIFE